MMFHSYLSSNIEHQNKVNFVSYKLNGLTYPEDVSDTQNDN